MNTKNHSGKYNKLGELGNLDQRGIQTYFFLMTLTRWLEKLSGCHNKVARYTRGCVALHRPCSDEHTLQFANLPNSGLAKYVCENLMHMMHFMHEPCRCAEICKFFIWALGLTFWRGDRFWSLSS